MVIAKTEVVNGNWYRYEYVPSMKALQVWGERETSEALVVLTEWGIRLTCDYVPIEVAEKAIRLYRECLIKCDHANPGNVAVIESAD